MRLFLEGSSDFEIEFDFFLSEMFSFLLLANIRVLQRFAMFNYLVNFNFYLFVYLFISFFFFLSFLKSSAFSYMFLLLYSFINNIRILNNFNYFFANVIEHFILRIFSLPKLSLFQTKNHEKVLPLPDVRV